MLSTLEGYGYRRFKLVSQAIHSTRSMPRPEREGTYVDARFSQHSSGPFGEESPGPWHTAEQVRERYLATRVRMRYAAARGGEVGGWFDIHAGL